MATFEQEIIIGIDLGTTYSCVAAYDAKVKGVVVLPNSLGARTTPSWVAFTEDGRVVGEPAKQQASMNVANTIFDIKRIIGRSLSDTVTVKETEKLPFKIVDGGNDRPVVQVNWRGEEKELSPEEISSMILLEMKRAAEAALGVDCKKAVVTVPAHFNDQQRQATKDAGRIAGLDIVRIINEPTAAALAYGLHSTNADGSAPADKANVMIFDLGGGTFDVSVLSMENGVFAVKSTGGDTHLGGEDFDVALLKWAKSQILAKHGQEALDKLEASERGLQRLRRACEVTKCNLSNEQKSDLEVDSLLDGETFSATITRDEFNNLSKGLVDTCMDTVRQVIKDAKINNEQVSDVVLVGGSTRIPRIQEMLVDFFDGRIPLCKSINPDEAVAHGAAVQAAIMMSGASGGGQALEGICTDIVLLDVAPLSLGIELEGSMMSVLIPRNTAIPCVKCREYTTVEDWQTSLDIVVYEGERPHTSANNKLGEFKVTGIERAKRGEPKIEVTFQMDSNGILHVTARDRVTGANATAEIKADRGRLTEDDIEKMISDAEKHREEDEALSRKINLKNALEETIYSVKSDMVEKNDIDGISRLEDLLEWVENDSASASMTAIESKCVEVKKRFGITVQPKRSE